MRVTWLTPGYFYVLDCASGEEIPCSGVFSFFTARAGEEKAKTLSHYGVTSFDFINGVKELLTIGSL